jgi:hypothetical protein
MTYIASTDIFVTIDGQPSYIDGITIPDVEVNNAITRLRHTLKDNHPYQAIWVGLKQNLPIARWQDINGAFIERDRSQRCTIANIKYGDCIDAAALMDNFFKTGE